MTTVVSSTSNTEVTTSSSYVSRWIAQSHGKYQKRPDEYYSSLSSSCDYPTSIIETPIKIITTTWQAQAKSRVNPTTTTNLTTSDTLANDNNALQDKLNRVR